MDTINDAAMIVSSEVRASRTAWVMSTALRVVSSVLPFRPTGAAAVMTGVLSGARRSSIWVNPCWRARSNSGQPPAPGSSGST